MTATSPLEKHVNDLSHDDPSDSAASSIQEQNFSLIQKHMIQDDNSNHYHRVTLFHAPVYPFCRNMYQITYQYFLSIRQAYRCVFEVLKSKQQTVKDHWQSKADGLWVRWTSMTTSLRETYNYIAYVSTHTKPTEALFGTRALADSKVSSELVEEDIGNLASPMGPQLSTADPPTLWQLYCSTPSNSLDRTNWEKILTKFEDKLSSYYGATPLGRTVMIFNSAACGYAVAFLLSLSRGKRLALTTTFMFVPFICWYPRTSLTMARCLLVNDNRTQPEASPVALLADGAPTAGIQDTLSTHKKDMPNSFQHYYNRLFKKPS
jgi:hypothetical protein